MVITQSQINMQHKTCTLYIDDEPFSFEVKGDFFWGKEEVLFAKNDAVLEHVTWKSLGFNVVKAFTQEEFLKLQNSVKENICNAIKSQGIVVNTKEFELEKYHEYITTQEQHLAVINITRNLTLDCLDFDIASLEKRFSKVLGVTLTSWVEELQKSHVQIRISRPNSLDINPPHRDGYFSYWNNIINIWAPIAGCAKETSLPIVPGSHLLPENEVLQTTSKGATINGITYHVPCLLESKAGSFYMKRPNPKEGEAILFTPYLIHGAAINQSRNTTRVALELRFPIDE